MFLMIKKNLKSPVNLDLNFLKYYYINNMEKKSKKSPVMKSKTSTGVTRKTKDTTAETATVTAVSPVSEKMSKLETAYMAAISGEMKFGEVKSIFKKLHKEIKSSVKSKK